MIKKTHAVLTASAIGDALGLQFETKRWNDPAILSWDGRSFGYSEFHKTEPGMTSDDTAMSIALTKGLFRSEQYFQPQKVAEYYTEWYTGPLFRGAGKTTRTALEALKNGVPWYESGELDAFGNGTAMRAAPIGAFYKNEPGKIVKAAKLDAIITHNSHEAQQGSIAMAMGVSLLLNGVKKEEVIEGVKRNLETSRVLDNLNALGLNKLVYDTMKAKDYDRTLDRNGGDRIMAQIILGTGYTAIQSVARAYYVFVATKSFGEAMELAIRAGGDCDTVAAMVGALCGAHYGLEGIDPIYMKQLENKDYLLELDNRLGR